MKDACVFARAAFLLLMFPVLTSRAYASQTNVELIIDDSGSMAQHIEGGRKIDVAKQVLSGLVQDLPADAQVAVRTYGRRRAAHFKDCGDMELLIPFGPNNSTRVLPGVTALKPGGMTPIAASLEAAAKDFAGKEDQNNIIILLSDGEEDCNGDPCAAAKAVHDAGIHLQVNVIGLHVFGKERTQLECVASEGGGKYYDAANARELKLAATEVKERIVAAAPPAVPTPAPTPSEPNLLAPDQGGQAMMVPDNSWLIPINGKDGAVGEPWPANLPEEAVYAFKDERPATFSKFEVQIVGANPGNIKDFELLAADDSPTGTFRSLGKFTIANARMIKSPYQEFTFPETTAKYLKVRVTSDYGGLPNGQYILPQFRLVGKLAAAPAVSSPSAAPPAEVNLLAPDQGGQAMLVADNAWLIPINGKDGAIGEPWPANLPEEAVYAFKNEHPATFSKFTVEIVGANAGNIQDFELFAADDSPTGTFRSLGKFTITNARMIKSPYQEFTFPQTTAKYLKVRVTSTYGRLPNGQYILPQFRLMGKPSS